MPPFLRPYQENNHMAQDITYVGIGDLTFKEAEDGSMFVYGLATDPTLDMDQQICDAGWLKSAMPQWFKTGANVREQHSNIAAGVGIELNADGDKWMLKSEVVDPVTQTKVRKGVLKGYSIGIKQAQVMKSDEAPNGVIVGGNIVEVSLVDRPANPSARIEIAKSVNGELTMTEIEKADDILQEAVMTEPPAAEGRTSEDRNLVCTDCEGEGKVHTNTNDWNTCEMCGGTGLRPEDSPLDIIQEDPSHPAANLRQDTGITDGKADEPEIEKGGPGSGPHPRGGSTASDHMDQAGEHMQAFEDTGDKKSLAAAQAHSEASHAVANNEPDAQAKSDAAWAASAKVGNPYKGANAEMKKSEAVEISVAHEAFRALIAGSKALDKADSMVHDPAELAAVRAGLIALIKAELDEMLAGTESEITDVSELLCSLQIFLDWWTSEASENETEAPFTGWDEDKESNDYDMAYMALGVSADLMKSATSSEATEELRAELRTEIVKALGLDDTTTKTALAEAKEELELLKADLAAVKEMATPGGPSLRMSQNQSTKSAQVDQLRAEADRYRRTASQVIDMSLRNAYVEKALKLEQDADTIAKN